LRPPGESNAIVIARINFLECRKAFKVEVRQHITRTRQPSQNIGPTQLQSNPVFKLNLPAKVMTS
jgi:hypothetical protein